MRKILKAMLIFFLVTNLSTGANAGREKGSFRNNYQTKQQQIHYARMTKNQTSTPFSPNPSSGMRLTTPVQQAIAIMLGLSLMVSCVEGAVPAHKKALPYPFRAPENEDAVWVDNNHNLSPCPSEVKLANEALLGFVHPGLFNRPLEELSEEFLVQACTSRNLFKVNVDGQAECIPDQELLHTLELDQSYGESELYDRFNSDEAWAYLQKEFFPKKGEHAALLPIKQFFGSSPKAFQNNIRKLNGIFRYGLSDEGEPDLEEFRPESPSVFIRFGDEFPALANLLDWKKYIQNNSPHLLDSYYAIEKIANNLPKFLKTLPVYAPYATRAASLPLDARLNLAIEYIAQTKTVENYLVLTENFSYAPPYSAKEFDKIFKELRKETLKLFENDPKKAAAYFHFHYVSIHPHHDGNGRTARAIMNLILMSAGIEPVVFPSNRQYTDACVSSSREKNAAPFEVFLRNIIETQQQEKELFIELSKKLDSCKKDCQALLDSHF